MAAFDGGVEDFLAHREDSAGVFFTLQLEVLIVEVCDLTPVAPGGLFADLFFLGVVEDELFGGESFELAHVEALNSLLSLVVKARNFWRVFVFLWFFGMSHRDVLVFHEIHRILSQE